MDFTYSETITDVPATDTEQTEHAVVSSHIS